MVEKIQEMKRRPAFGLESEIIEAVKRERCVKEDDKMKRNGDMCVVCSRPPVNPHTANCSMDVVHVVCHLCYLLQLHDSKDKGMAYAHCPICRTVWRHKGIIPHRYAKRREEKREECARSDLWCPSDDETENWS